MGRDLIEDEAEPQEKRPDSRLRFDLTINVALIVFLICQLGGFIWLFSGLSTDVNILMTAQPTEQAAISSLTTDVNGLGIRTGALEARVAGDETAVSGLASKRDSQIAAMQAREDALSQTVAAQTASLSAITESVNRILDLLQHQRTGR